MERLTAINKNSEAYYPKCFEKCNGMGASEKCDACEVAISTCKKLAAYENTGLTPAQLQKIDRLYRQQAKELMQYKNLEKEERLITLPCRIGDTVYAVTPFCEICEELLDNPHSCEECKKKDIITEIKFDYEMIPMFGKIVFLTKKEAEEELEQKR